MKSATASSAASSSASVRRRCNAGSSAISACQSGSHRRITEHVGRHRAERVDDARVELLAPPGTSHVHRSVDSLGAVEHLDGLGDMEQPHRQSDLLAPDVTRHAPAVPAGEHLLHLAAHIGAQAETLRHPGRGQAVGLHDALDRLAPGDDEASPRGGSGAAPEFPPRHGAA